MFANGSCLPERSARRSATVTNSVPLAISASRINSFEANFPVPTSRRDVNSGSAIFSFEGLSAMGNDNRSHGHARMSSAGKATIFHLYKYPITQDSFAMTKFDLHGQDCITGMSLL